MYGKREIREDAAAGDLGVTCVCPTIVDFRILMWLLSLAAWRAGLA